MKKEIKKEFTAYFKPLGFRVNSTRGEVFLEKGELRYFIQLFDWDDVDGVPRYFFKFGVLVKSPFEASYEPFEHSIYLNEFCYGGETTDKWYGKDFKAMLDMAKDVAIPWIQENMNLINLIEHIEWRIKEGLLWIEPAQFSKKEASLSDAGAEIAGLFGAPGNRVNHVGVRKYLKPLAIILNANGEPKKALECIKKYLVHIESESYRKDEVEAINKSISCNDWPTNH